MMRLIVGTGLLAFTAIAQTADGPAFEVASVKAAAPQEQGRIMVGKRGGPGTPDPGQVTYTNTNLKMLLQDAYDVKGFQISGPGWIDTERFDISAKIASGTTQEQYRLMVQNLLKERFKIAIHKETKELPVFALLVAKNGPKLKESVEEPTPPTDGAGPGGPSGAGLPPIGPPRIGKDGMPMMPKGGRGMMMMVMNGRFRVAGNQVTMGRMCDMLAQQVDRPVFDETGLKGKYDITLDFTPAPGTGPAAKLGMLAMHAKDGEAGGAPPPPPDQEAGPSLFTALQEQLGLRLEQKKGPVELIVVDKGEKVPTEN
jgi:uncharacterized protein (TIGR03435 family)